MIFLCERSPASGNLIPSEETVAQAQWPNESTLLYSVFVLGGGVGGGIVVAPYKMPVKWSPCN